jgi:hypothetical protein
MVSEYVICTQLSFVLAALKSFNSAVSLKERAEEE